MEVLAGPACGRDPAHLGIAACSEGARGYRRRRAAPGREVEARRAELALRLRVNPLREALARLAATGLVIIEDQRGFRVAPVSRGYHRSYPHPATAQCWALRQAIERGDVEWEARIVSSHHRLARLTKTIGGGVVADPQRYLGGAAPGISPDLGGGLRIALAAAVSQPACRADEPLPPPLRDLCACAKEQRRGARRSAEAILARDAERAGTSSARILPAPRTSCSTV